MRTSPHTLVVIHYHLRAGGVRRVIESCLPELARAGGLRSVIIAVGEVPRDGWFGTLRKAMGNGVSCRLFHEPAFDYFSGNRTQAARRKVRIRRAFEALFPAGQIAGTIAWAHNFGLGKNIILAEELAAFSGKSGLGVVLHHHDFWFDNRWARWAEMRRSGYGSLARVGGAVFSAGAFASHAAINTLDHAVMAKRLPGRTAWLPNPPPLMARVPRATHAARGWLARQLGDGAPVWISPARFLRRKNLAEGVLLTRWLRPEAWFVTTGPVSSPDEMNYANRLKKAAARGRWRVVFDIFAGRAAPAPPVGEIVSAAEVILLTSVQEGFGLPFLEAAALGKPLIARRLPNVQPDLAGLGFLFPTLYDDVLVAPGLFDAKAEKKRQRTLWRTWKNSLPAGCRALAGRPVFLNLPSGSPVPFSRLTLDAQLEILSVPPAESWAECAPRNPQIRAMAKNPSSLPAVKWPADPAGKCTLAACAARWMELAGRIPSRTVDRGQALRTQNAFIRQRLDSKFLHPLLMTR